MVWNKWAFARLKIATYKLFVYKSYIYVYMYKTHLALNNRQGLIWRKPQPTNQPKVFYKTTEINNKLNLLNKDIFDFV